MGPKRIIGTVLLVLGVVLIVIGTNASHSVADTVSNTFTGKFTRDTMLYFISGGIAAVGGLLMIITGGGARA